MSLDSMGCFTRGVSISNRTSLCSRQRGRVPLGRFLPKDTQLIKGHADTGPACFTYRASGTFRRGTLSLASPLHLGLTPGRPPSPSVGVALSRWGQCAAKVTASGAGVWSLGKGALPSVSLSVCPSWTRRWLHVLIEAVRGRGICLFVCTRCSASRNQPCSLSAAGAAGLCLLRE